MGGEFTTRVSRAMLIALAPLAAGGAVLAGWPGTVGTLAGALISLGSFRWIASGVSRTATGGAHAGLALSALTVGVRHLAAFSALALLLWSGVAHPVALLVGLSVMPPVIVLLGLRPAGTAG
jgi:hypothetical protein